MSKKVESKDTVKFSYTGRFESGVVFDTSDEEIAKDAGIYSDGRPYEPVTVEVGGGTIIRGIDKALIGMGEGEEKEVVVPPEDGYGLEDPNLITKIPIELFQKSNIQPQIGMTIRSSQGTFHITSVTEEEVEANFNNPLAGRILIFNIRVEEII